MIQCHFHGEKQKREILEGDLERRCITPSLHCAAIKMATIEAVRNAMRPSKTPWHHQNRHHAMARIFISCSLLKVSSAISHPYSEVDRSSQQNVRLTNACCQWVMNLLWSDQWLNSNSLKYSFLGYWDTNEDNWPGISLSELVTAGNLVSDWNVSKHIGFFREDKKARIFG